MDVVPPTPEEVRVAIRKMQQDTADWAEQERQRREALSHCPTCQCYGPD